MNAKITNHLHLLPKLSAISSEVESTCYSENNQNQNQTKKKNNTLHTPQKLPWNENKVGIEGSYVRMASAKFQANLDEKESLLPSNVLFPPFPKWSVPDGRV